MYVARIVKLGGGTLLPNTCSLSFKSKPRDKRELQEASVVSGDTTPSNIATASCTRRYNAVSRLCE